MILSSIAALALGQSASSEVRLVRFPDIHGDQYVFTYASDIWLANTNGGPARRLTSHPGLEHRAHFSPDGKWIAFSGQYDGGTDVYVMPADGGEPKRLTYEMNSDSVQGWTPDGKSILYTSNYGNHTNRMQRLWKVSVDGGLPQRTSLQECADLSANADGSKIAFTRAASHQFNWRRYRGGTQGRIAIWDFASNSYEELPTGREQNYFPMWVGGKIYFISDKNLGTLNLYSYDLGSKKTQQLTHFADADIRWPRTDGKQIIFERNLHLYTYDLTSGKTQQLEPRIMGDNLSMRPRTTSVANSVDNVALSPSGKRLIATARGELFSVPATRGTTRNLTDTAGAREQLAEWSADGQWVYYLTDQSGENKIVRQPQMGGKVDEIKTPAGHKVSGFVLSPKGGMIAYTTVDLGLYIFDEATGSQKLIHKDTQGQQSYEFSPDGKWIVSMASTPNLSSKVYLYNIAEGKSYDVTDGYYSDNVVTFDQTGKYLYMISSRTFGAGQAQFEGVTLSQNDMQRLYVITLSKDTEDPLMMPEDEEPVKGAPEDGQGKPESNGDMKVDIEGIGQRIVALPLGNGNYPVAWGVRNGVLYFTPDGTLMLFSMASKRPAPVMAGIQGIALNPDRSKFAYFAGPVAGITDVRPGQEVGVGRVSFSNMTMTMNPSEEYRQMFWEVWRYQRDQFYDPQMLGLDWDAIGQKYAAMLPNVGDRSDLDYIFGQLIGELGTGHAYVQPGPMGGDPLSPPAGNLGADFVAEGNSVKISKVYKGSVYDPSVRGPLGAIGVNVNAGDYILAIDGKAVTSKTGVSPMLIGKIGQRVTLKVNSRPVDAGSREVTVVPSGNETLLRYETWVDERRALVDKLSGGTVGYMHVPDTSIPGVIGFMKGYYSTMDKKAWLVDERYNGGGSIPTFFIDYLSREFTNVIRPRHGEDVGLPLSLQGPKAMLINEHAGSGGDLFPYLFKKAGLGPLIGTRTWGGLVGIQGFHDLIDGGGVTAPAFGIYDPDTGKWIAENTGVDPDVQIDDRPDVAARGEDAQLARGVQYLLDAIKKAKGIKSPAGFPRIDQ